MRDYVHGSRRSSIDAQKRLVLSTGVADPEQEAYWDRARQLDPSLREFQYPDFGFQDDLNLGPQPESKWALLFDYVK